MVTFHMFILVLKCNFALVGTYNLVLKYMYISSGIVYVYNVTKSQLLTDYQLILPLYMFTVVGGCNGGFLKLLTSDKLCDYCGEFNYGRTVDGVV